MRMMMMVVVVTMMMMMIKTTIQVLIHTHHVAPQPHDDDNANDYDDEDEDGDDNDVDDDDHHQSQKIIGQRLLQKRNKNWHMFTMFVKVPSSIIAICCGFFEGATQADFALLGENREHPHFRDQIECTL